MLIRPLRLGRFWPILYIKFFEVYLSQSNRETFCCNLFQVKCNISPASRVPELIPVLGSQPAGDVSHKSDGKLPLLSARPAVTLATVRGLLPISLLGEQRHNGCEQFV